VRAWGPIHKSPRARAPIASTGSDHQAPNQSSNPPGRWHSRSCRAPPLGFDWCCSASPRGPMSSRHSVIQESESPKCRRDTSARSWFHPPVRPACPGIPEPPFTPEILVAARAASKDCNVPRNACLTANRSGFVKSAKYRIGWAAGAVGATVGARRAIPGPRWLQPQIAAGPSSRAATRRTPGRRPRCSRPAR